jgi:hypothetical protein
MKILFINSAGFYGFGSTLLEAAKNAKVGATKQHGHYIAYNENKVELSFDGGVRTRSLDDNFTSADVHDFLITVYGTFKVVKGKVNIEVLDIFQ